MRILQITAMIVLHFLGLLVADEKRENGPPSELNPKVNVDNQSS